MLESARASRQANLPWKSIRWGSGQGGPGAAGVRYAARAGVECSLIDLGNRFRLLINEVDVVKPEKPLRNCRWHGRCGFAGPISHGGGGMDLRRRGAPYRVQPSGDDGGCWSILETSRESKLLLLTADTRVREFRKNCVRMKFITRWPTDLDDESDPDIHHRAGLRNKTPSGR